MKIVTTLLPYPPNIHIGRSTMVRRAHRLVRGSLRHFGIKSGACSECGRGNTVAHHEDYWKPLDVVWLCRHHHRVRHVELGWGGPKNKKSPALNVVICSDKQKSDKKGRKP